MAVTYEIPKDVHYSCTMCGDCCRRFDVLLGPGEEEVIAACDWDSAVPELGDTKVSMPSANPAIKACQLARRDDGACVFLGERNQCLIHEHFGEDTKPVMCRMYPFAFHRFGDRVGVDVAFSCNAVSTDRGDNIERKVPEWIRLAFGDDEPQDTRKHKLKKGMPVDGNVVWEFEFFLVQFLKNTSLPFADRVRSCLQFLKLTTTGNPTASTAGMFRDAIAEGIPKQLEKLPVESCMDKTQRAAFFTWLYLSLSLRPSTFHMMPTKEKIATRGRLLEQGERFVRNEGRPAIRGEELSVDFDAIAGVDVSIFRDGGTSFLEKYFTVKITGKRYLIRTGRELPLQEGAWQLFLMYPMTIWTAKALAADRGSARVEDADVRAAVRALDHQFGVLDLNDIDGKQRQAMEFALYETDLAVTATNELLEIR